MGLILLLLSIVCCGRHVNSGGYNSSAGYNSTCQEEYGSSSSFPISPESVGCPVSFQRDDIVTAAITGNNTLIMCILDDKGVDVDYLRSDGWSALLWAAASDMVNVVKLLVLKGKANVNIMNVAGDSPLIFASLYGFNDTVSFLLRNGAETNLRSNFGYSALTQASLRGHEFCVEQLLAHGANVNIKNSIGKTPLMLAASQVHANLYPVGPGYSTNNPSFPFCP